MLGQDDPRAQAWTVRTVTAFADAVKAVAGSNDPSIRGGPVQVLTEVFKNGGMFRRNSGKVIKRLVGPGSETGGGNIVAQNAAVDDLGEEGRLRNHLAHQVRDVLLALGSERLLVARASAKSDDDDLAAFHGGAGQGNGRVDQGAAEHDACGGTQKVSPREG